MKYYRKIAITRMLDTISGHPGIDNLKLKRYLFSRIKIK